MRAEAVGERRARMAFAQRIDGRPNSDQVAHSHERRGVARLERRKHLDERCRLVERDKGPPHAQHHAGAVPHIGPQTANRWAFVCARQPTPLLNLDRIAVAQLPQARDTAAIGHVKLVRKHVSNRRLA